MRMSKVGMGEIWKKRDEGVKKCCMANFNNLPSRRTLRPPFATWSRESHGDVVVNCHIKKDRALGDCSDMLSCPIRVEVLDVLVTQRIRPSLYDVHTNKELRDGGFA